MTRSLLSKLTPGAREAFNSALTCLVDDVLDDIVAASSNHRVEPDYLPPRLSSYYDASLLKVFLVCVISVAERIERPRFTLRCVGEELALSALLEEAEARLHMEGTNPNERDRDALDALTEAFEDIDFKFLWDEQFDGIENDRVGEQTGIVNLNPRDWFKPFRDSDPVHLYLRGYEPGIRLTRAR